MNWNFNESTETFEDNLVYVASMANKGILDSGTTKSCASEFWLQNHKELLDEKTRKGIKTFDEKRNFRFGNNVRYPSLYRAEIPLRIGDISSVMDVSIIKANIPLLIGLNDMKKFAFVIDCDRNLVKTKRTGETFELEKINKHLALPLVSMTIDDEEDILIAVDDSMKEKNEKGKENTSYNGPSGS